jgi:hypothetical protein
MRLVPRAASAGFAALLLTLTACSGDPLQRQAVSGSVSFKGTPIKVGNIDFSPLDGQKTMVGSAIEDGKFSIPRDKGLSPGRYKVTVNAPDRIPKDGPPGSDTGPMQKELIPAKYNTNSTLEREVKAGQPNVFDISLD